MSQSNIGKDYSLVQDQLALPFLVKEPLAKTAKQKAVVLLHGVGSNEQALFNFSQYLPEEFYIITPRGPITLGPERYAWYQVDFSTGTPVINADQETSSRDVLRLFINQVKQKYHVDELYLGGFSQGAIMSYTIGLTAPDEVAGILSLSGRILNEIKPFIQKTEVLQHLKVFVAHGVQDRTLPVSYAIDAKEYLLQAGVKLSYHEFDMGHQVNNQVLNEIIIFLNQ